MRIFKGMVLGFVVLLFGISSVHADVKQIKLYKEAFPSEKPKCMVCHLDKIPKKDEGKHELNEYGLKVQKGNAVPDAETYKKVGKAPEVKEEK